MVTGIGAGGLALLATVFLPYWFLLSRGEPVAVAQTAAFSAWLIGHVLLAFVSRSSTDPLHRVGFFSNRVMLLWGAGAMLFLVLALAVPAFGDRLGITAIGSGGARACSRDSGGLHGCLRAGQGCESPVRKKTGKFFGAMKSGYQYFRTPCCCLWRG